MFCKNCGEQISEGGKFCTKCGTPVAAQQQPAMPSQTPQYTPGQPQQYQQTAQTNMNAWEYFVSAIKKYAVFNGRARRAEYWWFVLFNALITWGALLVGGVLGLDNVLYILAILALFLPGLAAAVRRMHDVGKSGWYCLIPIYNIVLLATAGNTGPNQYGPDPKGE